MRRSLLALLLAAGCATPAAPPPPEPAAPPPAPTFAVQLHRPRAIGHVLRRSTTMTLARSHTISSNDAVLEQQASEVHVRFVAREKVLDHDERGSATRNEYVVEEAFSESQSGRVELLPAGAVLLVSRGVGDPMALAEGRMTPEAAELLEQVINTSAPGHTDDEIFGTSERQPVGGSWPIQAALATEDLATSGLHVSGLGGEVTLAAMETVAGSELMRITAKMAADSFAPTRPTEQIKEAHLTASFEGHFPTDPSRHRTRDAIEIAVELVVVHDVDGAPVQTQTHIRRHLETTYSEL